MSRWMASFLSAQIEISPCSEPAVDGLETINWIEKEVIKTNQKGRKKKKRIHDKEEKFVTSDKRVHISAEFITKLYVLISSCIPLFLHHVFYFLFIVTKAVI